MVTMGVERSWGKGRPNPVGPYSPAELPCCFSACIEASLAWGPSRACAWGFNAQVCRSSQRDALVLFPFR